MALVHDRMFLLPSLVVFAVVINLLAAAQTSVPPSQAKQGCRETCGDIIIPYPFGIGAECSLRPEFTITCNESTRPPSARFTNSTYTFPVAISYFSLDVGELQVMQDIARNCYDDDKGYYTFIGSALLLPPTYTISTKNNCFIIGCNVVGLYQEDIDGSSTGVGVTLCTDDLGPVIPESCIGFGCTRTSIPGGLQNISIGMSALNGYNASDPWAYNYKCSYAFVVEEGNFTFFPKTSFQQLNSTVQEFPVAVDWAIGDESCEVANKSTSCKEHSLCVNRSNITDGNHGMPGYICKCLPGYEGNAYLGCQDVNECLLPDRCGNGKCKNSQGNYSCDCNKGFKNSDPWTCIEYSESNNTSLKISLGTGGSLVLFFVTIAAWYLHKAITKRKKRILKEKFFKQNGGLLLEQQSSSSDVNVEKTRLFNSKELEKATDCYNLDRVLGHGGQGTVYKGMLMDGRIVAVKKSTTFSEGEVGQFINEIVILSQINHRNVVRLLGCCLETEVPLLVYEFLPNGTLSHCIQHQDEEFPLTWEARLRVAIEVAGALSYLHSAASFPIYHRDIKTTNILLDEKYIAKVADFGTSKSVSIDQTHLTTQVAGTFGYLDPEYFQSSQLTDKSDVYSFGVVLVELLTGEKPVSLMRSQESRSLAAYFLLSMENSRLFEILDAQVIKGGTKEEIMGVANVAQRCLNLKGKKRPTMKEVAAELESLRLPPIKDSIIQKNSAEDENLSTHEMTTKDCNHDFTSTWYCTTSGTCTGSSLDVHPLLFFNTQ